MSYSDNNYYTGDTYGHLGFSFIKYTVPDYYWFLNNERVSRQACQVYRLKSLYAELYDPLATNKEDDIMLKLGARKVYRCGNTRWELLL